MVIITPRESENDPKDKSKVAGDSRLRDKPVYDDSGFWVPSKIPLFQRRSFQEEEEEMMEQEEEEAGKGKRKRRKRKRTMKSPLPLETKTKGAS